MTEPSKAQTPLLKTTDRIIVALDVETADEARVIVGEIGGTAGAFKVGLQLFVSAGPEFVRELTSSGAKIFLDLKFHDIPNTVAKASVEAAKLGVWMFNMHAGGGREMMSAAAIAVREFCGRTGSEMPIMLGVTVLTSTDTTALHDVGIGSSVEDHVARLARQTFESGLTGVVASPRDVSLVRNLVGSNNFLIVTPGIRPIGATKDDQKRVTTAAEAIAAGSDYLVIGRPITAAADRKAAIKKIIGDIDQPK